jgi:hypothetical protein
LQLAAVRQLCKQPILDVFDRYSHYQITLKHGAAMDILEQIDAVTGRVPQDFDGRDEILIAAAREIRQLRATSGSVVWCPSQGDTLSEMRSNVRNDPLYKLGDAKLVWVNEGDLVLRGVRAT